MFFRILKKELKRKRTMNVILFLFITMAAMFLASSVGNLVAVSGAVDYFIGISKVPDTFAIAVQEFDKTEIASFLKENEGVTEYEVINSFNITNDRISILKAQSGSKEKYERTNTLAVQAIPDNFMKVFDLDGNPVELCDGEIAFSKLEAEENNLWIGDKVSITIDEVTQEFTIAAITKDVVFGSAMMGFKRLCITQEDFERFADQKNLLYTQIYCIDYKDADCFEKEWQEQQFNVISVIKKDIIPMCYVFDMLIAGILIIVSICLILIAFLVLRFTIQFTLQQDFREIGIMKAIGLRDAGIKSTYLVKYLAIAFAGAAVGLVLSVPFGEMLLKQAVANIVVNETAQNFAINVGCAGVIVGCVLFFSNTSANKLKKFSAIDAIRNGSNGERYQTKNRMQLWKRNSMKPGFYMACNDILSNPRRFLVLGITFCIGTLMILLPLSALHTLKGEHMIELFGLAPSDAYIDNAKGDSYVVEEDTGMLQRDMEELEKILRNDGMEARVGTDLGYMIPCYASDEEEMVSYYTQQEAGSWERSYTVLEGREPVAENELMITEITADEMGVSIGDIITYQYPDHTQEFMITGIYQSLMNMGNGFRVSRAAELPAEYMSGFLGMQVEIEDMDSEMACARIQEIFPDYKVMDAQEFVGGMVGGITDQIDLLMYLLTVVVLAINSLITILTMKTMLAKERGDIALLKSLGFGGRAIRAWQTQRIIIILVSAIAAGTILSKVLAPVTIAPIFAMMGASRVTLETNLLETYLVYPAILLFVTALAACLCAREERKVNPREVNNIE